MVFFVEDEEGRGIAGKWGLEEQERLMLREEEGEISITLVVDDSRL